MAVLAVIKKLLEGQMERDIDDHVEEMEVLGINNRRKPRYERQGLQNRYQFFLCDGVVLMSCTGTGARRRVVLVAVAITQEGSKR